MANPARRGASATVKPMNGRDLDDEALLRRYRYFFTRARLLMNYGIGGPPAWHEDRRPQLLASSLLNFHRESGLHVHDDEAPIALDPHSDPAPQFRSFEPLSQRRLGALEDVAAAALLRNDEPGVKTWARFALSLIATVRSLQGFNGRVMHARALLAAFVEREREAPPAAAADLIGRLRQILDDVPMGDAGEQPELAPLSSARNHQVLVLKKRGR